MRCVSSGFNTQPPEGGWIKFDYTAQLGSVSTHSRPKAAGLGAYQFVTERGGFNTQPPEGGWLICNTP